MDAVVRTELAWNRGLDLATLRKALARSGPRMIAASHRAGLFEHPCIGSRAALGPGFHISLTAGTEDLPVLLGKQLRRAGVEDLRLREAIAHEASHLARIFSALADDPYPRLELSLSGSPGDGRLPADTRLALVWPLPLPGEGEPLPGSRVAARLPEGVRSPEPLPDVAPGSILVLRLEPGPTSGRMDEAPGPPRLVLWLASPRLPDPRPAGDGWDWSRLSRQGAADVLLVSMPFGPPDQPSLALSLLKGTLPPGTAEVLYFTLPFARRIGRPLYTWIAEFEPYMTALVGEWLFRHVLFPEAPGEPSRYLREVLRERTSRWLADDLADNGDEPCFLTLMPDDLIDEIVQVRALAEGFVDHCVEEVLARRPRVVGLTSVFQQHAASLALARRLKERAPEIAVVFGGSNCEGVMGIATARNFPFLDAVVCGEGEVVFPRLVERLLAGGPVDGLQGVYTSASPEVAARVQHPVDAPSPRHLDDLPYPAFEDFFRQFDELGLAALYPPRLLLETSRGCWWGEKAHCTFCGLNGTGMAFRSKSPDRALAELTEVARRYPGLFISTADNILDRGYFHTFLPRLAEAGLGLQLFYEVKANLRKEEIRALRAAGVTWIQPGIESLSDQVLRIMRKGIGVLQNVRLLKWCEELGVRPVWNLIWGFPGELPEEYGRMCELLPLLHHLPAPRGMSPIYVERFSPNHSRSGDFGFSEVRAAAAYGHVYPFGEDELDDLAYFFSYSYQDGRDTAAYTRPLMRGIVDWRDVYGACRLTLVDRGDHLLIFDTRPIASCTLSFVEGLARELYLACDDITSIDQLCRSRELSRDVVEESLGPLIERRQLLRQGDSLLALAVPGTLGARPGA